MGYLVFLDLDDTIIKGQSQKFFIRYLFNKRLINYFVYFYIIFWFFLYRLGFIKNVKKIREKFFKICSGWNEVYMNKILLDFFNNNIKKRFYPRSLDLINYHRKFGAEIVLLSASIYPLVKIIADFLGLNFCIATNLKIVDGVYTGEIDGNIIYGVEKRKAVLDFIKKNNLSLKGSYAYGDHISDLYLLLLVDNPFIVNPDHSMVDIISKNNLNSIFLN